MKRIALLLLILTSSLSFASNKATYSLYLDQHMNSGVGAEDIITFNKALLYFEDEIYAPTSDKSFVAGIGRFFELSLIWSPVTYMEMLVQHEVFGHGAQIRNYNDKNMVWVQAYSFDLPPPYDNGSAATRFSHNPALSEHALLNIYAGGVNATGLLGVKMQEKWIESEEIDGREALLYLHTYQDLTDYAHSIGFDSTASSWGTESHDIELYLKGLSSIYKRHFKSAPLKNVTLLNLLDPFTFYSLVSVWDYIAYGETAEVHMLNFGDVQYLPTFRVFLAPYGPEISLINYFKTKDYCFSVTLTEGAGMNPISSHGISVHCSNVLGKDFEGTLGFQIDVWKQPELALIESSSFNYYSSKTGGALILEGSYPIYEEVSVTAKAGYKTKGFLVGEAIDKRLLAQIGLSFKL